MFTINEARGIADKVMIEKRVEAKKRVELTYEPIIKKAALDGKYKVEIRSLNDIEAEVLRMTPYNFHVYKVPSEAYYGSELHIVSWEQNPKEFGSDL